MSVDSKESSSKEAKVEEESNIPEVSGENNESKSKSNGETITSKNLSPTEIIKTFEEAQQNKKLPEIYDQTLNYNITICSKAKGT